LFCSLRVAELAQDYVAIVGIGQLSFALVQVYSNQCTGQGKPFYSIVSCATASIVHWILAPILCVQYGLGI
jgi:multidrug resistance protein, MATE family